MVCSCLFVLMKADRLRRMRGDVEEESKKKRVHFSADDLNDGFILDKEDKKMLAYQVTPQHGVCFA